MEFNFKSSDTVFNRIEEDLPSYAITGMLDVGRFYDWTKTILKKLEIPAFNQKEELLIVSNYQAALPDDFYKAWAVWSAIKCETKKTPKKEYQGTFSFLYEDTCYEKSMKGNTNCTVTRPIAHKVIQRDVFVIDNESVQTNIYNNVTLLKAGKVNSGFCVENSPSYFDTGKDQFQITDKEIHFNFKEGEVLIQYFAFEKDMRGLPMIPDDVYVEAAVETYIMSRIYRKLYYEGAEDVQQRYQTISMEHNQALREALYYINLPSYQELLNMAKKRAYRWYEFISPEIRMLPAYSWYYNA